MANHNSGTKSVEHKLHKQIHSTKIENKLQNQIYAQTTQHKLDKTLRFLAESAPNVEDAIQV